MASATGGASGTPNSNANPQQPLRDCILLAACGPNEILPMSPDYPVRKHNHIHV